MIVRRGKSGIMLLRWLAVSIVLRSPSGEVGVRLDREGIGGGHLVACLRYTTTVTCWQIQGAD